MIFAIANRCKTCSSTIKNIVNYKIITSPPIRLSSITTTNRYPDYEIIYKFPLITLASAVNRVKLYQIVCTGVGMTGTSILAALDIMTTEFATLFAVTGISWCLALCVVGFFGHNRVGFIYMKNDGSSIKISYTDFWGRRAEADVDVDDIWPLSDLPTHVLNPFHYNLRRYSTDQKFKFNLKYGVIVDPIKFTQVFGDPKFVTKR